MPPASILPPAKHLILRIGFPKSSKEYKAPLALALRA